MNIKQYLYLIEIEEKGNISAAAKSLGISQPALSKFLKLTGRQLGIEIFLKSSEGLIPTEAGRIYLEACHRIVEIRNRAYAMINSENGRKDERIIVGGTPFRGTQMFSEVFPKFIERYPNTSLVFKEMYMSDLREGINKGEVSLALGTLALNDVKSLGFASSSYDQLCLAVPLSHPTARLSDESGEFFPVIDMHNYEDSPFIMWGDKTTNSSVVNEYLMNQNISPTVVFKGDNALMVDEMLRQGIGVGFIPRAFCKPGQNRVYFSTWPPIQNFIGVFYKKDRVLSEAEQYFIYLILKKGAPGNSKPDIYHNTVSRQIIERFGERHG